MADTTYYVNTASAGGDGTGGIDVLDGATAAYASRAAAEAARQGTIAVGDRVIISCGGTASDGGSCTISGWTVNGRLVFEAHPDYRHVGIWDDTKFSCDRAGTSFNIQENNVDIQYIQFAQISAITTNIAINFADPCDGSTFKRNIIRDKGGANKATAMSVSRSTHIVDVCFNLILDCGIFAIDTSGSGTVASYFNNTIINTPTVYTYTKSSNKPTFKNNLIYNSTNGITGTVNAASDYNGTDSTTFGTGYSTNTNDRVSQTFTFVNAGSSDYHLQSSDAGAKGFGVDLSASIDAVDIDGETIVAPWCIGADWITSGGGGVTVTGLTANYNYSGIGGVIDLTGEVIVTGITGSYDYAGITGSVELGAEVIVVGQTASYNYSGIDGVIDLTPLVTVTGQTANYDYDGLAADIILQGSIIVTGSTASYDYNALNATIIIQGPIVINPKNIIIVKGESNTIRVKQSSGTIRVERSSNIIRVK